MPRPFRLRNTWVPSTYGELPPPEAYPSEDEVSAANWAWLHIEWMIKLIFERWGSERLRAAFGDKESEKKTPEGMNS